jgi:septum site-determining protein MinC
MGSVMQIKGIREGLLITLGEGHWPDLEVKLLQQIEEQEKFFKGGRVALDVGNQILHAGEMSSLRDRLSDHGVSLWAIIGNSPVTEQTALLLGLATKLPTQRPERTIRALDTHVSGDAAVLVQRTLRSGVKIAHSGHVVIIGDVNPGAEVIAGGNVIVWGRLRGGVHAGANGNDQAVVCALDLTPTQLRIADKISMPPPRKGKSLPEMAQIVNGQVVAVAWNPKGK